jgi:hypothetical protein
MVVTKFGPFKLRIGFSDVYPGHALLSEFWQNSQYLVEHNGIYFAGENS